jgi:energy-coupling factor transport system permease protein
MLTMRDTHTAFDTCHPSVPATYFAAIILIAIFAMQPVCVCVSLAGGLAFSFAARGWHRTLGGLRWQLPVVALVAVANPLFSASGSTLAAQLGSVAIYQESIAYGACAGVLLVATILWFEDAACVLTQDRLLQLGARALPTVTLVTSMAAQLVPQLMRRSQTVRTATLASTAAAPEGSREQLPTTRARLAPRAPLPLPARLPTSRTPR